MKKILCGLAAFVMTTGLSFASDDLETEHPNYLPIHLQNPGALKEAFEPDVQLRMIEEPSFQMSSAVFVAKRSGHYVIVRLKMDPDVEYAIMRHDEIERLKTHPSDDPKDDAQELALLQRNLPPYPKDEKPNRCEVEIDSGFFEKVAAAWRVMLVSARPHANEDGLDGTFYHFALNEAGKNMLGQTWSPGHKTRPGRLVAIASKMANYCESRRDNILREAEALAPSASN